MVRWYPLLIVPFVMHPFLLDSTWHRRPRVVPEELPSASWSCKRCWPITSNQLRLQWRHRGWNWSSPAWLGMIKTGVPMDLEVAGQVFWGAKMTHFWPIPNHPQAVVPFSCMGPVQGPTCGAAPFVPMGSFQWIVYFTGWDGNSWNYQADWWVVRVWRRLPQS